MDYTKTLKKILEEIREDFDQTPYDYVSYEIEAQARIATKLREKVKTKFLVDLNDSNSHPNIFETTCVKMEWPILENKHDIVILKENKDNAKSYKKKYDYNDIEAFIEIKVGWDFQWSFLEKEGVVKDLKHLSDHPDEGYFVFFLADKFSDFPQEKKEAIKTGFLDLKRKFNLRENSCFLVFRDEYITF